MILSKLIKPENIIFIDQKKVNLTLVDLVNKASELSLIKDKKEFLDAILERENIVSTGIGLGIAIPHSKLESIDNFFIIIGILKNDIEWKSIDSKPVKAVFMIGGPSNAQKKYLGILSKLMLLFKNPKIRNKLFTASVENDVVEIFKSL
ncbi:MAG: PTS sugar transporter subunit IIA [Candidatus Delongbacteria bacterium]|jgi:mannitol/fructose-specific phosphotransferase system IIA component (Ntr-type)|nr:PTS sugar transporter subunit IIA [Candidatus Delongbacteria bacterium]